MSLRFNPAHRRAFIGGSDARIIMGEDGRSGPLQRSSLPQSEDSTSFQ
jgi:hypothetical protein